MLIDLAGQPLVWHDGPLCGTRVVVGTTCPATIACPLPGDAAHPPAAAGAVDPVATTRPGGIRRVRFAERSGDDRIAAGAVCVPAP